jgi:hypothetical protein
MENGNRPLLSVRNLKTYFFQDEGTVKAVGGAAFGRPSRKDARDRGGKRMRKKRHHPIYPQAHRKPRPHCGRGDRLCAPRKGRRWIS